MLWLSVTEEEQGLQEAPNSVFSGFDPVLHSAKEKGGRVSQPCSPAIQGSEHEDKDGDNVV